MGTVIQVMNSIVCVKKTKDPRGNIEEVNLNVCLENLVKTSKGAQNAPAQ